MEASIEQMLAITTRINYKFTNEKCCLAISLFCVDLFTSTENKLSSGYDRLVFKLLMILLYLQEYSTYRVF